jgi:hypothetical protein
MTTADGQLNWAGKNPVTRGAELCNLAPYRSTASNSVLRVIVFSEARVFTGSTFWQIIKVARRARIDEAKGYPMARHGEADWRRLESEGTKALPTRLRFI